MSLSFRLVVCLFSLLLVFSGLVIAQGGNPFAPKPAPSLPAGMTGANKNDPRAKLAPGMYDAGETSLGIRHISLMKKPEAFQLANDPNDPKVNKAVSII